MEYMKLIRNENNQRNPGNHGESTIKILIFLNKIFLNNQNEPDHFRSKL